MNRVWSFVLQQCSLACSVSQDKYLIELSAQKKVNHDINLKANTISPRQKNSTTFWSQELESGLQTEQNQTWIVWVRPVPNGCDPQSSLDSEQGIEVICLECDPHSMGTTRSQVGRKDAMLGFSGRIAAKSPGTTRTHPLRSVPSK